MSFHMKLRVYNLMLLYKLPWTCKNNHWICQSKISCSLRKFLNTSSAFFINGMSASWPLSFKISPWTKRSAGIQPDTIPNLVELFSNFELPFNGIQTLHERNKFIIQNYFYVVRIFACQMSCFSRSIFQHLICEIFKFLQTYAFYFYFILSYLVNL